jgi:hypothetical protein
MIRERAKEKSDTNAATKVHNFYAIVQIVCLVVSIKYSKYEV